MADFQHETFADLYLRAVTMEGKTELKDRRGIVVDEFEKWFWIVPHKWCILGKHPKQLSSPNFVCII